MSEWWNTQAVNATGQPLKKIGLRTQTSLRCPASSQGSFTMKTSPGRYCLRGMERMIFFTPSAMAPAWPGVQKVPCTSSWPRLSVNMQV